MSQHRSKSVLGVDYEPMKLKTLTTAPMSLLRRGELFCETRTRLAIAQSHASVRSKDLEACLVSAAAQTMDMETKCFELSQRVASSVIGLGGRRKDGADRGEVKIEDIRSWLA